MQLPDNSTVTYTYDPFGRRVMKSVDGEVTNYFYANEGLIGEYTETGATKKAYAWRPNGIWGTNPLLMQQDGATFYYHNDHLGTPMKMTDVSGAVVWSVTYSAFGEAEVDAASTIENNLRFPGQYWDEETGLHYNWNRYYDPEAGRYTQIDPIRFGGGDSNLFRYVQNNQINASDPSGLYGFLQYAPAAEAFLMKYVIEGKLKFPGLDVMKEGLKLLNNIDKYIKDNLAVKPESKEEIPRDKFDPFRVPKGWIYDPKSNLWIPPKTIECWSK